MTNPASPIADFYPTTFAVDMEGKRAEWEGVVLICFIDETRLLQAEATITQGRLTAEERARNKLGDILIYSHDDSLKDGARPLYLTKKIHAVTVAVHGCFLACALQTEHALLETPLEGRAWSCGAVFHECVDRRNALGETVFCHGAMLAVPGGSGILHMESPLMSR